MIASVIQDPALFSASSFAIIAEQLDKKTIQKLKALLNANTKELTYKHNVKSHLF